jgi:hypothetical protein
MINYVSYAQNRSEERIGYGLVLAVAYPCTSNVSNSGYRILTNNLIKKHTLSSTGSALSAIINTINLYLNTIATAANISIPSMTEI